MLAVASNRRRFENAGGEPPIVTLQQDELRLEAEDAVEAQEGPELGEEAIVEDLFVNDVPAVTELPVCWIWSQLGAVLTKAGGETREVGDGTLLAAYGWVPGGQGQVAVNLGDEGKWFIRLDQWVVYRREA